MNDAVTIAVITCGLPLAGVVSAEWIKRSSNIKQVKLSELELFYTELQKELSRERASHADKDNQIRFLERQLSRGFRIFRGFGAEVRNLSSIMKGYMKVTDPELQASYHDQMERVVAQMELLVRDSEKLEDGNAVRIGEEPVFKTPVTEEA